MLSDVTATVGAGLTLPTGPSGAGKSTLLRVLAAAERPGADNCIGTTAIVARLGFAARLVLLIA